MRAEPTSAQRPAVALDLLFFFSVGWPRTETVRGVGQVGRAGGVGAMDGAIELTWTYLQRPLHGPPAPPIT
ncbi:hypothetical protein DUW70_06785 [Stenotrophomonas maltophilia]|nr:hypothetical protein DUW70_06785 [Stenotrophomonas maltophilia]